jgi:hypothetical protein
MDPEICEYCGGTLQDPAIRHRQRVFCSDDCCEAFEDELVQNGEPAAEDLAATEDPPPYAGDLEGDLADGLDDDLGDAYLEDDDF